jgi:hypothetical protein
MPAGAIVADQIALGPLALDDVLKQIIEALEYARHAPCTAAPSTKIGSEQESVEGAGFGPDRLNSQFADRQRIH